MNQESAISSLLEYYESTGETHVLILACYYKDDNKKEQEVNLIQETCKLLKYKCMTYINWEYGPNSEEAKPVPQNGFLLKFIRDYREKVQQENQKIDTLIVWVLTNNCIEKIDYKAQTNNSQIPDGWQNKCDVTLEQVINEFNAANFNLLAKKPKLFFLHEYIAGGSDITQSVLSDKVERIPTYSDLWFGHCTTYKMEENASKFVEIICEKIKQGGELTTMFTNITGDMIRNHQNVSKRQNSMPQSFSTLTKFVNFKPALET